MYPDPRSTRPGPGTIAAHCHGIGGAAYEHIMGAVGTLQEVTEPLPHSTGEWTMLCKPGTDVLNGKVKIRVGSIEDAKRLEQLIQGCVVVVGGRRVSVLVDNPMLLHGPANY